MSIRILVVDDEPAYVQMIKECLETRHYEVFTASNGEYGVEAARKEKPNLIIMDIHMPVMDGYHAVRELRKKGSGTAHIPIIVLSARGKMKGIFHPDEIVGFVEKPFELESLMGEIRRVLHQDGDPRRFKQRSVVFIGDDWVGLKPTAEFLKAQQFKTTLIRDMYHALEAMIVEQPTLMIVSTSLSENNIQSFSKLVRRFPRTKRIPYIVYDLSNMKNTSPHKVEEAHADLFISCGTGEQLLNDVRGFLRDRL